MKKILVICMMIFPVLFSISLQESGYIRDNNGVPVSGTLSMSFSLYTRLTGGQSVWNSGAMSVTVIEGTYSVEFGTDSNSIDDLVILSSNKYYLEQVIQGEVLSPRKKLASVVSSVYSVHSSYSDNTSKLNGRAEERLSVYAAAFSTTADIAKIAISLRDNHVSQFNNDSGYLTSIGMVQTANYSMKSGEVDWVHISNRPESFITEGTKVNSAYYSDTSNTANISKILLDMRLSQFTNDSGYLTEYTESDPMVRSYAKTKDESTLVVGTANVAKNVAWLAVNGKPSEYTPADGSVYYLADTWVPTWGQIQQVPLDISRLGNSIESSEITTVEGLKIVGVVGTADYANISKTLVDTKVSQFTNDSGYLTEYTENDPMVRSYAKTKDEGQLEVAKAQTSVTADVAKNIEWTGIINRPIEYTPADGSTYYLADNWIPTWGQVQEVPLDISRLGNSIESAEITSVDGEKVFGIVGTANVALSAKTLMNINISQFINNAGYLITYNEVDPTVKQYAKNKDEYNLLVNTANYSLNTILFDKQPSNFYQDASHLSRGILSGLRLSGEYIGVTKIGTLSDLNVSGDVRATKFIGDGSQLTGFVKWNLGDSNKLFYSLGNIGIGVQNPLYKLTVDGTISAREILVTQEQWADFVFERSYKLMSLVDLEKFILDNQHLPNVPCNEEVQKNGVKVSEMQSILLRKIEELTLYVIELKKEIDGLKE